jgi:hypothetical protein
MAALAVIEHFDGFKHCRLSVLVGVKVFPIDEVGFEGVKTAFCHGVVLTIALPAHTGRHPVLGQDRPVAVGAILTPTIGMHDEAHGGLTRTDRHRDRLAHQGYPHMVGHCPPDDRPRAQLQDDGPIEPAFACGQVGPLPNRDGSEGFYGQLPIALARGHALSVPHSRGRFDPAPCGAAQARLGHSSPKTTPTALQSLLRHRYVIRRVP